MRLNLRTHAAFTFTPENTERQRTKQDEANVRMEDIRSSFNSPFWPHILASTSVGQDGLDFHAWCRAVVHWDLPANALDLEQREGRIEYFAGLASGLAAVQNF